VSVVSAVSFQTTFVLDGNAGGYFLFTDTTDYAASSIPSSAVVGVFEIVAPSLTVIYNNTDFNAPDINRIVSADSSTNPALPIIALRDVPETGDYVITYTVQIDDGMSPVYYVQQTNTITNNYSRVTPSATVNVNCASPLLTITDTTPYTVGSTTPTVDLNLTLTYPVDPETGAQVHLPLTSPASPITTATFYNGIQVFQMSNAVSYEFVSGNNGFFVTDTIIYQNGFTVSCQNVCAMYCCLRELEQRMAAAGGGIAYQQVLSDYQQCAALAFNISFAYNCGRSDDVTDMLQRFYTISKCTPDCGCSGSTPTLVTGLGTAINVIVESGGAPVRVTSSTVGSTTSYFVSLTQEFLNQFNSLRNSTSVPGTGINIVNTTLPDGSLEQEIINTAVAVENNIQTFQVLVEYSNYSAPAVAITPQNYLTQGANFINASVESVGFGTDANWKKKNNRFRVFGFQTVTGSNFKASVNMTTESYQSYLALNASTDGTAYNSATLFFAEITDTQSTPGEFYVSIRYRDGSPMGNESLVAGTFLFDVTITE